MPKENIAIIDEVMKLSWILDRLAFTYKNSMPDSRKNFSSKIINQNYKNNIFWHFLIDQYGNLSAGACLMPFEKHNAINLIKSGLNLSIEVNSSFDKFKTKINCF